MSEYRHGISEKIETIWGESWEKKDGLTGKFRLKGTSRDHLVQIAAANKVNFKMLFMVLARPVLKFSSSTVSPGFEKDSRNWNLSLKNSSSVGLTYNC